MHIESNFWLEIVLCSISCSFGGSVWKFPEHYDRRRDFHFYYSSRSLLPRPLAFRACRGAAKGESSK